MAVDRNILTKMHPAVLTHGGFALCLLMMLSVLGLSAQTFVNDTIVLTPKAKARIDFKVNISELDTAYHGNSAELREVLGRVDSLVNNPLRRVVGIEVVGASSPEGPYQTNALLATKRAYTFANLLQGRYSFPDSIYTITTIPEDWDGMRQMLVNNPEIPYGNSVLHFLETTENMDAEVREQRLKRLDDGHPYASMHDNVLPYLRRASVTVSHSAKYQTLSDLSTHEENNHNIETLSTSSLQTLDAELPTYTSRRYFAVKTNLIGIALLCANIGFEAELLPKLTLDLPFYYSPYDITERWRIRLLAAQPTLRYWLREAGTGHHFDLQGTVGAYNVSLNTEYRYQNPDRALYGIGLGYGYAVSLGKHWAIDFSATGGFFNYKFTKYINRHNGPEVSRGKGTYWGLTSLNAALVYRFYTSGKGRRSSR